MVESLNLDAPRHVAFEDPGQYLLAGLDQSLGPACLLGLESGHLNGQLGRALDILHILELPALELRAVREVGVFGQRVMLPAAAIFDSLAPPHPGGAVEVEEDLAARAAAMLENEMPVEQDGFDLRQKRVIAVEMGPAGLHHPHLGIG